MKYVISMATQEEERILDIKVRYQDAIDGILKYQKALAELNAQQKELKKQSGLSAEQQREVNRQMEANKSVMTQYKDNVRVLRKELQNNLRTEEQQEGSLKQLRAQLSNATKAYDELSRAERNGAKGKEMQKHINDITTELKKAEESTQRFYRNVGNYEGAINNAIFGNSKFGASLQSLTKTLSEGGVSGALEKAKAATGSFFTTFIKMFSNPYFLAMAGVAGAGAAFKWFWDYNEGLVQATKLTKAFTGLSGDEMRAYRDEVQAVSDTMGTDFRDTLTTASTLAKNFGIDATQALGLVKDGLISGGNISGDFLNNLKEYAGAFKDLGVSANQFTGIMATISKQGLNVSTTLGSIQRGGFNLQKMSTTLRNDLNAMGVDADGLSKKIQTGQITTMEAMQQVGEALKKNGVESQQTAKVMQDMFGKGAIALGSNFVNVLTQMGTGVDKLKDKTGELGKLKDEQIKTQAELNNSVAALFDMTGGGFEKMKAQLKLIATKALVSVIKAVISCINYFIDWYNESLLLRAAVQIIGLAFKQMWGTVKLVFNLIIDAAKSVGRSLKGLADIVEGIVTLSWDKIKSGFSQLGSNFGKTFKEMAGDAKSFGKEAANNLVTAFNNTVSKAKMAHINVPKLNFDSDYGNTGGNSGSNNGGGKVTGNGSRNSTSGKTTKNNTNKTTTKVDESAKKELAEVRKAEDLLNQLIEDSVEQQRATIKATYDRQIEDLQKRLSTEKDLTVKARAAISVQIQALQQIESKKLSELDSKALQERIKQENDYYDELLKSVKKGSDQEYQLTLDKMVNQEKLEIDQVEQSKLTEEQKQQQVLAIQAAYNKQYEDAEKAHGEEVVKAQVDAAKKALEERTAQAMNDYYEGNATEDPEITKLRLQMEERKQILDEAQQAEGESLQEFNQRKLGYENEYYAAKEALNSKGIEVEKAKYDAINSMIGGAQQVAEAFGENSKAMAKASKVLSLAQIAISTGVALAEGVKQAQSVPFPANIAAIATTVTTILANIATAVKTVKSAKFAEGGDVTGPGTGTSDSVPAKLSNGESVLTAAATSMFAPALSAFNQIGGGVPIYGGSAQQQIGEEYLANAVARGMAMAPRQVVSVEEISTVKNRVETLERIGSV